MIRDITYDLKNDRYSTGSHSAGRQSVCSVLLCSNALRNFIAPPTPIDLVNRRSSFF